MTHTKETILIVDDKPTNLGILFEYLENENYKVRVATDPELALRGINYSLPDLILLDIMMPNMDGYEMCRLLKGNPTTKDIPVIFMTALTDTLNEIKAFQSGAVDYITKPVRVEQVLARVQTHLALQKANLRLAKQNSQLQQEITRREQVEIALRKSETRYRHLVETANCIILKMDTYGNVTFLNHFAQTFFDYTETEILGRNVIGTIVPETETTGQDLRTLIADIQANPNEYRHNENENITKTGQRVWVKWSNKIIYDDEQNAIGLLSVGIDVTEQKEAERALRKLSRVVEQSSSIIMITDLDSVIEFVNPALFKITGYTESEVIGKTPRLFKSGRTSDKIYDEMWQALIMGNVWKGELLNKKKDGELYWEFVTISPIKNETDQITHYVAIKEDITARKQIEIAIQETNHKLRARVQELAILNQIVQMVSTVTELQSALDGVTQQITELLEVASCTIALLNDNQTTLTIVSNYFRNPDELSIVGTTFPIKADALMLQVISQKQTAIVSNVQTNPLNQALHKIICKQQVDCLLAVPLLIRGQVIGVIWMTTDLTDANIKPTIITLVETIAGQIAGAIENARLFEEEHHQRQVAESLQKIAMVLSGSLVHNDVIATVLEQLSLVIPYDSAGILTREEDRLILSDGIDIPYEFINRSILLSSEHPAVHVAKYKETIIVSNTEIHQNWESWSEDHQIRSWMGAPLLVGHNVVGILTVDSFKIASYHEKDAQILQAFANHAAIALENARLFNEAELARQEAETANKAKSTFLANMSHELRTPLNAIMGFSQLMTYSRNIPSDHQENLHIIHRSGEHLLTLINDVLDMSKIEAGHTVLKENDFDLYRLLNDLEDMFSFKSRNKQLQLIFERATDVPQYIHADETKLRQVLINLLNNALKFTKQGGVIVQISGKTDLSLNNAQHQQPTKPEIHFSVTDTGPGIASHEIEHVFEAFVQTQTGLQAQEGTGLGLPISQKFVTLMGGDITIESPTHLVKKINSYQASQLGTTFYFYISCQLASPTNTHQTPNKQRVIGLKSGQPMYRILVVDDNQDNRHLLVKLLEPLNFEVQAVSNGQEAVELYQTWYPHLIWMDMRMPILNGYTAAKLIKQIPFTISDNGSMNNSNCLPYPFIIAMSAGSIQETDEQQFALVCDDFLRKPYREVEIFDLVAHHLGVEYLYEETTTTLKEKEVLAFSTLQAQIANTPSVWRAEMNYASLLADSEMVLGLIEQIKPSHLSLAKALIELVDGFQFESLIKLTSQ